MVLNTGPLDWESSDLTTRPSLYFTIGKIGKTAFTVEFFSVANTLGLILLFSIIRQLCVFLEETSLQESPVNAGVPQGLILGPAFCLL